MFYYGYIIKKTYLQRCSTYFDIRIQNLFPNGEILNIFITFIILWLRNYVTDVTIHINFKLCKTDLTATTTIATLIF